MGATVTKPLTAEQEKSLLENKFVIEKNVKDNLDMMRKYLDAYQKSDINQLLAVMEQYKQTLAASNPAFQNFDIGPVKSFVENFQKDMTSQINKEFPGRQYSNVLNDPNVAIASLKKIYETDSKQDEKKQNLLQSPLIKNDDGIKRKVEGIFNSISNMKARLRFFEHRYIQLNVFLVVFFQHTVTSVQQFIDTSLSMINAREQTKNKAVTELVEKLLSIIENSDLNVDPKEMRNLNTLVKKADEELERQKNALNAALKNNGITTVNSIVNTLGSGSGSMAGGALTRAYSAVPKSFYDISVSR
jgi:hypothetical protein